MNKSSHTCNVHEWLGRNGNGSNFNYIMHEYVLRLLFHISISHPTFSTSNDQVRWAVDERVELRKLIEMPFFPSSMESESTIIAPFSNPKIQMWMWERCNARFSKIYCSFVRRNCRAGGKWTAIGIRIRQWERRRNEEKPERERERANDAAGRISSSFQRTLNHYCDKMHIRHHNALTGWRSSKYRITKTMAHLITHSCPFVHWTSHSRPSASIRWSWINIREILSLNILRLFQWSTLVDSLIRYAKGAQRNQDFVWQIAPVTEKLHKIWRRNATLYLLSVVLSYAVRPSVESETGVWCELRGCIKMQTV